MAESASPLGNPLLGSSRLEMSKLIGHRTITKEMINKYIQHLEEKYPLFDTDLEPAPPNKWDNRHAASSTCHVFCHNFIEDVTHISKQNYLSPSSNSLLCLD